MIKFIIKIFNIIFLYLVINTLINFNNLKYKNETKKVLKEQTIIKKEDKKDNEEKLER